MVSDFPTGSILYFFTLTEYGTESRNHSHGEFIRRTYTETGADETTSTVIENINPLFHETVITQHNNLTEEFTIYTSTKQVDSENYDYMLYHHIYTRINTNPKDGDPRYFTTEQMSDITGNTSNDFLMKYYNTGDYTISM